MLNSIVLKPGPAGWPETRLTRAGTGSSWIKNRGRKNPVWPSNPSRPSQKPGCNLLTYVFFVLLKRRRFDNFFLKIDPVKTRWPGQNPEPRPWTGPGLKLCLILCKETSFCKSCRRNCFPWIKALMWYLCIEYALIKFKFLVFYLSKKGKTSRTPLIFEIMQLCLVL